MEMENKYASKGVAGTALGLGIGAVGVELLRGGVGGILGGGDDRYVASLQAKIGALESEASLLKSNIYIFTNIISACNYIK